MLASPENRAIFNILFGIFFANDANSSSMCTCVSFTCGKIYISTCFFPLECKEWKLMKNHCSVKMRSNDSAQFLDCCVKNIFNGKKLIFQRASIYWLFVLNEIISIFPLFSSFPLSPSCFGLIFRQIALSFYLKCRVCQSTALFCRRRRCRHYHRSRSPRVVLIFVDMKIGHVCEWNGIVWMLECVREFLLFSNI